MDARDLHSAALAQALTTHPRIAALVHALRKIANAGPAVTVADIKTYAREASRKYDNN